MANVMTRRKSVHVNKYTRERFGKIECVCEHWRSHPNQMLLCF
jgi:hypothetical protein